MLNIAVQAARAAGAIINRAALDIESVRVSQKLANDCVTEVDQNAERAIIETLLTAYPDHGIWAEESGQAHGNPRSNFMWIIDPLDGTTNFIHGYPVYCVSIGLAVRDKHGNFKMDQAVVYDPTRNDLFTASKGRGAYMNDRRIRVGKRLALKECLLTTGLPFRAGDDPAPTLAILADVMRHCVAIRRGGAAALDLAYVAAGFADGYFETGLFPWDVAAGSLLITEAGGLVGNYSGEANFLETKEVVCGNPKIYGQLVGVLGRHSNYAEH